MAKCIPTELPNWVLQEERRSTEIRFTKSAPTNYRTNGIFFIVVLGGV